MTTTIERPVATPGDERILPDAPPDPVMEVFGLNVFYGDFHAVHDVNLSFGKHEITRQMLNDDVLKLWYSSGIGVVFVTHSVFDSAYLSSRVVVL